MTTEAQTFLEYLKASGPPPDKPDPRPFYNQAGNIIHWYWGSDRSYEKSIFHERDDGLKVWIGSLEISMETNQVVGVKIHGEAIKGLELSRKTAV